MFKAKRIKPNRYALFEDAAEFAQLTQVRGKWLLSTANADLKRLFDATVFAADATLQAVLWAVRAILDHLREIAAYSGSRDAEAHLAKFAATFKPVVNPRNGRVSFSPRYSALATALINAPVLA
jgi:hypothetical protein